MLIFGKSVRDWKEKAAYAVDKADNEYAKLHEVRCEGIEDVEMAMAAMAAFAADSNCRDFLYHATINLNPDERLTREQWIKAIETLEKNLGLSGHHRITFEHIKKNRQHYHIYWSRLHPTHEGPAVNMGNNYYIHQSTAKELEKEFGLNPAPRRDYSKSSRKKQEADGRNSQKRVKPDKVTEDVTRIYKASQTAKDLIKNLAEAGYTLTRGKRGSYVIVDRQGGYHGLLRRIQGVKLDDVRKKLPELDKMPLPSLVSVLRSRLPPTKRSFKRAASSFTKVTRTYAPRRSRAFITYTPTRSLLALVAQAQRYHPPRKKKYYPPPLMWKRKGRPKKELNQPTRPTFNLLDKEKNELLTWAWENKRYDILMTFGIILPPDYFEL